MGYLKHTYKIIVIFHVWKYDFSQLWESLLSTPVYVINIFIVHSNARKSNEPIQKSYFKWHPIVFIQQVLSNKPLKGTYKTAAWFITNKNHTWLGINRIKSWKSPQWDKAWAISRGIRYTALKNSVVSFFFRCYSQYRGRWSLRAIQRSISSGPREKKPSTPTSQEPNSFPGSIFFPSPGAGERDQISRFRGRVEETPWQRDWAAASSLEEFWQLPVSQISACFFLFDGVPVVSPCTLFLFYGGWNIETINSFQKKRFWIHKKKTTEFLRSSLSKTMVHHLLIFICWREWGKAPLSPQILKLKVPQNTVKGTVNVITCEIFTFFFKASTSILLWLSRRKQK